MLMFLLMVICQLIKQTIKDNFNRDCDVIQSELAKQEDEELCIRLGLGKDEESVYKNMLRDEQWCDKDILNSLQEREQNIEVKNHRL